jgi:hypothetical protein
MNLTSLTDSQLLEMRTKASEHNPETGYTNDPAVAYACGLERKRRQESEFTFSLTYSNGGTEALTMMGLSRADAEGKIAQTYPGATLNWIL